LQSALTKHPELIAYSCYARQLEPFISTFGKEAILPVFFERLITDPQGELERVTRFIGYNGKVEWHETLSRRNVSAERLRKFAFFDLLVEHPLSAKLRRGLVPKGVRTKIRRFFSMDTRPELTMTKRREIEEIFDEDLAIMGKWLGISLNCGNFRTVTSTQSLEWQ